MKTLLYISKWLQTSTQQVDKTQTILNSASKSFTQRCFIRQIADTFQDIEDVIKTVKDKTNTEDDDVDELIFIERETPTRNQPWKTSNPIV